MADYAPNFTARYRLRYSTLGLQHAIVIRLPSNVVQADITPYVQKLGSFLQAISAGRYTDWTMLNGAFAPANSDVFLPAQLPTNVGPGLSAVPPVVTFSHRSLSYSWPGRSTAGHRAILYLITVSTGAETAADIADARLTSQENTAIADSVNALNASPPFVGNDDKGAVWYPYVNLKHNSYWTRQSRG